MSKPTDNFWGEFSRALASRSEKKPTGKGWIPLEQWITASGGCRSATNTRLTQGWRAGLLEKFEGNMLRGDRLVRAVWYRRKGA